MLKYYVLGLFFVTLGINVQYKVSTSRETGKVCKTAGFYATRTNRNSFDWREFDDLKINIRIIIQSSV